MNTEMLEKLLEYIDARIAEKSDYAQTSSDGGLIEKLRADAIRGELLEMANNSRSAAREARSL